jgi:polyisoprenoid-binding protein YceI
MKLSRSRSLSLGLPVFCALLGSLSFLSNSRADSYALDAASRDGGVQFSIPYKLGTHDGPALDVMGSMEYDVATDTIQSGVISIQIINLDSGNSKRDCHLQEAIGLNYAISAFPEEHVCENGNVLPETGPDSIQYPEIRFTVTSSKRISADTSILKGALSMHGISRPIEFPVTVKNRKEKSISLAGSVVIALKDYGIEVKPFLFVSVGELATVTFDVTWVK